jgi:hypothetical protein
MDAEKLRKIVEDAHQKGELGLFLWASLSAWDELMLELEPGNKDYDSIIRTLKTRKAITKKYSVSGLELIAFFSVPVESLFSSNSFFNMVLKACEAIHLSGPVTLIPSRKTSEFC